MNETVPARKIVVGVDSSEESDAALAWACAFAGEDDQINAVYAWDLPVITGYDALLVTTPDDVEPLAKAGLAERVEREEDDRIVPVLCRGHAGRSIVSEGADADLIVVGHRGESRIGMMLGSTANYVVHHTERPIVIARGDEHPAPHTVVVGVDDFDDPDDSASVRALQWAYQLPDVERIEAIHAWYLPPLAVGVFPAATNDLSRMDEAAQSVATRVVHAAGDPPPGVTVVAEPARGTGGFALIEASRRVDLVVVGRRGHSGFSELLLGSTSADVAAHAHSPVAIIR